MPHSHDIRCQRTFVARVLPALLALTALLGPLTTEATATRTPTGGGGTVVLEPVPALDSRRAWRRLVYTCRLPGVIVFSDRPCGPLPIVQEIKGRVPPVSTGASGASSTVMPPMPAASVRPAPSTAVADQVPHEDERETTCRRLHDAVRTLDDRMRAGYSAREAALLWNRWREAKQRLREADC